MNTAILNNDKYNIELPMSAMAIHPVEDVSDKYSFVPTYRIVDTLTDVGWHVVKAVETKIRNIGREGFQKHMIHMRHEDFPLPNGKFLELLIINSHDRSYRFSFAIGIYRMICSNGLIVGNEFGAIRIKHMFHDQHEIIEATEVLKRRIPLICNKMSAMEQTVMPEHKKLEYVAHAAEIAFPNRKILNPEVLLTSHRVDDSEDNLWNIYNKTQENIMKGGRRLEYKPTDSEKLILSWTRQIKSIRRTVQVNQRLWDLSMSFLNTN